MVKHLQDLQLTVLVALVLKDFLDGDCLTSLRNCRLKHDTERAITDYLLRIVGE